jgi:methylenetetrahydrofolate reductase (NADPH)
VFGSSSNIQFEPNSVPNRCEVGEEQAQAIVDLLRNSSIELSTNGEAAIRKGSDILPSGMSVYVPKMPRQTLTDKLVQIALLSQYGLSPIPHIVARQLTSAQRLREFLQLATSSYGVSRVLVIGGDDKASAGPFADAAAVIASGILVEAGIREVDVAGYPDGHPQIPSGVLRTDLETKISLAEDQGFGLNVVTQFSFSPESVAEYCRDLADIAPAVPVFAGLVGPTSPVQLLRFAKTCGVGTSLRAANKLGLDALKLASHSSPDKQFEILARRSAAQETGNLAGIHLFSFGGFVTSAGWLDDKARRAGLGS